MSHGFTLFATSVLAGVAGWLFAAKFLKLSLGPSLACGVVMFAVLLVVETWLLVLRSEKVQDANKLSAATNAHFDSLSGRMKTLQEYMPKPDTKTAVRRRPQARPAAAATSAVAAAVSRTFRK
eukprot:TRINITY_DN4953_c0_g1_i1.p3 TRINITY_DN4953_c0_g1~~TRINITY_DN4953_c0_g1_i1.p3  ORF type:complete len:123 (+),score=29.81 TRINITY_DN4953_c0_g1_i1:644-1012(+)